MSPTLQVTLTDLLATLRAIHWHAWQTHWKAQGTEAYSDHLLFERIYSGEGGGPSINAQIDGLGERIIALFGNKAVNAAVVAQKAAGLAKAVAGLGRVAGALKLEQQALAEAAHAADLTGTGSPEVRIGIDNFVRELADARSTVIYLLKQRLAGGADAYGALTPDQLKAGLSVGMVGGLLLFMPFVVTPFVLKAFVPDWSYGRRVVAGVGVSAVLGAVRHVATPKQVLTAGRPNPDNVLSFTQAEPSNLFHLSEHPNFGRLADPEADPMIHRRKKDRLRSTTLYWALLAGMAGAVYWNAQHSPKRD